MSDEELNGSEYIRHPPSYRLAMFSKFIEKLDSRLEKRSLKKRHPRTKRIIGSPVSKPVPPYAKKWMIKPELRAQPTDQGEDDNEPVSLMEDEEQGADLEEDGYTTDSIP